MSVKWSKRHGFDVAFGRDGDNFHVAHNFKRDESGIIGAEAEIVTTNAREAVINYTGTVADCMARKMLAELFADGYDYYSGEKVATPKISSLATQLIQDGG